MNVRPAAAAAAAGRLLLVRRSVVSGNERGMSKKGKPPTHYETLEVNNRATQGEIKTAYFKLSKQYHPDKNSSDAATAKFREVAEAYEVLGNYNSRKSYDRSILTHTEHRLQKDGAKQPDPNIKYYQSQAALYRQSTKSGSAPMYDFDAWTKAHYGTTLNRTLKDKVKASQKRDERARHKTVDATGKDLGVAIFAFIFITTIVAMRVSGKTDYDQAPTIRQREELHLLNRSDPNLEESPVELLSSK